MFYAIFSILECQIARKIEWFHARIISIHSWSNFIHRFFWYYHSHVFTIFSFKGQSDQFWPESIHAFWKYSQSSKIRLVRRSLWPNSAMHVLFHWCSMQVFRQNYQAALEKKLILLCLLFLVMTAILNYRPVQTLQSGHAFVKYSK